MLVAQINFVLKTAMESSIWSIQHLVSSIQYQIM